MSFQLEEIITREFECQDIWLEEPLLSLGKCPETMKIQEPAFSQTPCSRKEGKEGVTKRGSDITKRGSDMHIA